jgi:hypothetical protein
MYATSALTIDNNIYFVNGVGGVLGYFTNSFSNSFDVANITAWRTFTNQDVNSIEANPLYVSTTDLHIQATSPARNQGANLGVTDDFDGDVRPGANNLFDIGADEFISSGCDSVMGGTASVLNAVFCDSGSTEVSVNGYTSADIGITYQWQSSTDALFTSPVNETTASATYSNLLTGTVTANKYYRLLVNCSISNNTAYSNVVTITVNTTPTAPTANAQSFCTSGTIADLVATGTAIQWYLTNTGGSPFMHHKQ